MVQSVESSNRIEGVEVAPDRLRPLVLGRAKPADRSEAELHGYREALKLIYADAGKTPITPAFIKQLHKMIQAESGDAGQFKKIDNEIVELKPGQSPVVRFVPVPAKQTAKAVEEICRGHRLYLDQKKIPPLLADALMVLDFLCIHPFRDGNGRVSRLLTLHALHMHGYEVGRYISLERLVEDAKEDYYSVLHQSSQGWHEGKHDWQPWVNFHLGIIHRAYRNFEERVDQVKTARGGKRKLVEDAIDAFKESFTMAKLQSNCPGVSRDMIRQVLRDLKKSGIVECQGRGPGALWVKK